MNRLAGSSKLLRAMNESATLAHLLDQGALTRADLRELTGLSKPTTSDVLRRLTDAGLAVVVGHTSGGPGPNAEIYAANPVAGYAAAISVRETAESSHAALIAALCDLAGTVVARSEASASFGPGGTDAAEAIVGLMTRLCDQAGLGPGAVRHVQLGVPGSYDSSTGIIRHIDVPGWDRPGLVDELERRLGATLGVENDVNLAAIAERSRGVAKDCENFALVWFSQGLGLAIDLGGSLLRGAHGGAGEIGYVPVGLGRGRDRTDLQDLAGGPAVLALAGRHGFTAATPDGAVRAAVAALPGGRSAAKPRTAEPPQPRTAEAAAAEAFLDALAEHIALGLAAVAAVLDPPLIVLAGDVAQAGGEPLVERVTAALRATTPLDTSIAVTGIADDPVLLGALDSSLRAVREALINALRDAVPAA
jgi:predicted NBD/HSP70 family sugar kinase